MAQATTELSAQGILRALYEGKTVRLYVETEQQFKNLRNRVATLKAKEDEVLLATDCIDEAQSLSCSVANDHESGMFLVAMKLSERRKPRTYQVLLRDDTPDA